MGKYAPAMTCKQWEAMGTVQADIHSITIHPFSGAATVQTDVQDYSRFSGPVYRTVAIIAPDGTVTTF